MRIGVTGATGTIGSHLLRVLSGPGASAGEVEVIAFSRDPDRQPPFPRVRWLELDLADRRQAAEALDGVERLFLLTGNGVRMVELQKKAVDAAARVGVERVVKLSALGATDRSKSVIGLWHWAVERHLMDSGLAWTLLRPHHFMQNLLDAETFDREEGVVYSASGEGRFPMVDTRDVAEVAASALLEPGHEEQTYTLTGPEAISYRDATAVLAEVLGREVDYRPQDDDATWRRLRRAGYEPWRVAALLAIAGYQREEGPTARISPAVEEILGRPPRGIRTFVEDHHGALGRPGA